MINIRLYNIINKNVYLNSSDEFMINLMAYLDEDIYGGDTYISDWYVFNIPDDMVTDLIIDYYNDDEYDDYDDAFEGEIGYIKVANLEKLETLKEFLISQIESYKKALLKETGIPEEDIRFWV